MFADVFLSFERNRQCLIAKGFAPWRRRLLTSKPTTVQVKSTVTTKQIGTLFGLFVVVIAFTSCESVPKNPYASKRGLFKPAPYVAAPKNLMTVSAPVTIPSTRETDFLGVRFTKVGPSGFQNLDELAMHYAAEYHLGEGGQIQDIKGGHHGITFVNDIVTTQSVRAKRARYTHIGNNGDMTYHDTVLFRHPDSLGFIVVDGTYQSVYAVSDGRGGFNLVDRRGNFARAQALLNWTYANMTFVPQPSEIH